MALSSAMAKEAINPCQIINAECRTYNSVTTFIAQLSRRSAPQPQDNCSSNSSSLHERPRSESVANALHFGTGKAPLAEKAFVQDVHRPTGLSLRSRSSSLFTGGNGSPCHRPATGAAPSADAPYTRGKS